MGRQSSIVAAVALLIAGSGPAIAEDEPDSMSAWTGFDGSLDSQYGYAGGLYAFTGDLDGGGLLARFGVGGGQYQTSGANSHPVNHYDLDLMLGYHLNLGPALVSLYAGGDFQYHANDDLESDIRGAELGAKGLIEAYAPLDDRFFIAGYANYSTSFNTFAANMTLAYRVSEAFSFGPQAGALGCEGFNQVRAGLVSAWHVSRATELAPWAGAAWKFDENDYGLYGGVNLYTRF